WNSAGTTSRKSSPAPTGRTAPTTTSSGRRRPAMAVEQHLADGRDNQTRIHDIGYRNYDGPRLGRAYARRSLYSQSLRGAYGLGRSVKSKVLPMLLFVVMCVPAAIMVAVA